MSEEEEWSPASTPIISDDDSPCNSDAEGAGSTVSRISGSAIRSFHDFHVEAGTEGRSSAVQLDGIANPSEDPTQTTDSVSQSPIETTEFFEIHSP